MTDHSTPPNVIYPPSLTTFLTVTMCFPPNQVHTLPPGALLALQDPRCTQMCWTTEAEE